MTPNGRNDGHAGRLALLPGSDTHEAEGAATSAETHLVFDFTGLSGLDLADLSWVLTARLGAGPDGTVWVREIPFTTWQILRGLGLDHLFNVYPGTRGGLN